MDTSAVSSVVTSLEATDSALVQVREQWRARSLGSVWLRPSDWFHEVVDDVVAAVTHDVRVHDAIASLGVARATHGVSLGEAIDDLSALYRTLDDADPPLDAVRALCEGWSSPAGTPFLPGAAMDPESGLPTLEYFAVRLAEEYAAVRRRGADPARELHLVLVDVALGSISAWDRMARSAAVGQAVEAALGPAWPGASLGGGGFALLQREPDTLDDDVVRLRTEIVTQGHELGVANIVRQPPRVWVESVPNDHRAAIESLVAWRR